MALLKQTLVLTLCYRRGNIYLLVLYDMLEPFLPLVAKLERPLMSVVVIVIVYHKALQGWLKMISLKFLEFSRKE